MNVADANIIFRTSIIKGFFEPKLLDLDFKKSAINHPVIENYGLMQSNLLHIFFDLETGADYPDGDEWFIVEFLFPNDVKLPDTLKGSDYFTTLFVDKTTTYWHHRELIRYKYGKSKKLEESIKFIETKYNTLHEMVEPLEKDIK